MEQLIFEFFPHLGPGGKQLVSYSNPFSRTPITIENGIRREKLLIFHPILHSRVRRSSGSRSQAKALKPYPILKAYPPTLLPTRQSSPLLTEGGEFPEGLEFPEDLSHLSCLGRSWKASFEGTAVCFLCWEVCFLGWDTSFDPFKGVFKVQGF